ncbi:MAG: hypothetical protein IT236_13085 [Bacteroidia bacterium]|nr:hypothetical protein [Bacteroidia bacterium]
MKKILYLILFAATVNFVNAQISFNYRYNSSLGHISGPYLDKLSISGYKYVWINKISNVIQIYNTNYTLFKSINIPTVTTSGSNIYFVTETLFDNNSLIEYAITTAGTSSVSSKFYIFNENGTQLFYRDSVTMAISTANTANSNGTLNDQFIVFDGVKTVMRLAVGYPNPVGYEYYNLPGSLPCIVCTNGTVTSMAKPDKGTVNSSDPIFYPNPASTQLKLKYELPKNYKSAVIEVRDSQGKQLESYKVTDVFDHIYLPNEYNNGLYFYSLVVDGVLIKTEKIILNK